MSNLPRFGAGVLLSLTLVGCANADLGPKQTVGTLLGAGTGALIGAQFGQGTGQLVATSVGTLLGAYLGNEAGKSLDRADALYASRAEYQALEYTPSGTSTPWRNPDSGHYGRVTPIETFGSATARTAASSSTRRRSAAAAATSTAPRAAPPTANGRWCIEHALQTSESNTDRHAEPGGVNGRRFPERPEDSPLQRLAGQLCLDLLSRAQMLEHDRQGV